MDMWIAQAKWLTCFVQNFIGINKNVCPHEDDQAIVNSDDDHPALAEIPSPVKVVWHIGCQIRFYDKYCYLFLF